MPLLDLYISETEGNSETDPWQCHTRWKILFVNKLKIGYKKQLDYTSAICIHGPYGAGTLARPLTFQFLKPDLKLG